MTVTFVILALTTAPPAIEPEHEKNAVYTGLRGEGITLGGTKVVLPPPLLVDGMPADKERQALLTIVGDGGASALSELTRDSVSAPFVLKLRDEKDGKAGVVRLADLWFVVHADLATVDPARAAEDQTVEAGNMRFTSERVKPPTSGKDGPGPAEGVQEWFVRTTARLLDRIHVESTNQIVATRSDHSWVVASKTDPRFSQGDRPSNVWYPLVRKNGKEEPGKAEPYPGGASYVKISRLASVPGALLVEAHFAFYEPHAWFDGAPILRSKLGVVAQDRIRGLRRELAKSRKPGAGRSTP